MNKFSKVFLLILSIFVLAITACTNTIETLEYEAHGNKYVLSKFNNKGLSKSDSAEIEIPAIYLDSVVFKINDRVFEKSDITKVKINGNNLTSIGKDAFKDSKLEYIDFKSPLKYICESAFENTPLSGLEYLRIPNTVIEIGKNAFKGTNINLIFVPENVKRIESGAFDVKDPSKLIIIIEAKKEFVDTQTNWIPKECLPENIVYNESFEQYELRKTIKKNTPINVDSYEYEINNDGTLRIKGLKNSFKDATKLIIYSSKGNKKITSIENGAFKDNKKIQFVEFDTKSALKSIGDSAFENCTGLSNIILPKGLKEIGNRAFANVHVRIVHIPSSVTHIGKNAFDFAGDDGLPAASKNYSDYTPAEKAIYKNTKIYTLVQRKDENTGEYLLTGWVGLSKDKNGENCWHGRIPDTDEILKFGVEPEDSEIFEYNATFDTIRGLKSRYKNKIENLEIPLTKFGKTQIVYHIADDAFVGEKFQTISFRNNPNIKTIGKNAFKDCKDVSLGFTLPPALESIGDNAFANCEKVKSEIRIPEDSIISIGSGAFENCKNLPNTSFDIDRYKKLTTIGDNAFKGCSKIFKDGVRIDKEIPNFGKSVFENCKAISKVTIINVKKIPDGIFKGCNGVKKINIDETPSSILKLIGEDSFVDCKVDNQTLRIPPKVTTILNNAFKGCTFKTIFIPNTVKNISGYAFSLEWLPTNDPTDGVYVQITEELSTDTSKGYYYSTAEPGKQKSIDDPPWYGVFPREHVYYARLEPGSKQNIFIFDNDLVAGLKTEFSEITDIELPEISDTGVKIVGIKDYAFKGKKLEIVRFNKTKNYKTIGDSAFIGNKNLEGVIELPPSITKIGNGAFSGCKKITEFKVIDPTTITYIGDEAFSECTSANIRFKNLVNLKYLGKKAFYKCFEAREIEFKTGKNNITVIKEETFTDCKKLSNWPLTDDITLIGKAAFSGCTNMSNGTKDIPRNLTILNDQTFKDCEKIKNLTIPENVTVLPPNIFEGCKQLDIIKLHDNITEIGSRAFANSGVRCSEKKKDEAKYYSFYLPSKLTFIGPSAFKNCKNMNKTNFYLGYSRPNPDPLKKRPIIKGLENLDGTKIGQNAFTGSNIKRLWIPTTIKNIQENVFDLENTGNNSINCEIKLQDSFNKKKNNYFYKDDLPTYNSNWTENSQSWHGAFPKTRIFWSRDGYGNSDEFEYKHCDDFGLLPGESRTYGYPLKSYIEDYGYVDKEDLNEKISNYNETLCSKKGYCITGWTKNEDPSKGTVIKKLADYPDTIDIPAEYWGEDDIEPCPVIAIGSGAFYASVYFDAIKEEFMKDKFDPSKDYIPIKHITFERAKNLEYIKRAAFNASYYNNYNPVKKEDSSGILQNYFFTIKYKIDKLDLSVFKDKFDSEGNPLPTLKIIGNNAFASMSYENGAVLKLPETKDYKIINDGTFKSQNITVAQELIIPDNIKIIGNNAFKSSNFDGNIRLEDGIRIIGSYAFYCCRELQNPDGDLNIKNVEIFEDYAFDCCNRLSGNINITNALMVGKYAFASEYNANYGFQGKLIFGEKIKSIGSYAFSQSDINGDLLIPDSVESIGVGSFAKCNKLDGLFHFPENPKITKVPSILLAYCGGLKGELKIPDSITTIENEAFEGCRGFDYLVFNTKKVNRIEHGAFYGCSNIKLRGSDTLDLSYIDFIGYNAFYKTRNLNCKINFGNKSIVLESGAFNGSSFVGDIILPDEIYDNETSKENNIISISQSLFQSSGFGGKLRLPPNLQKIGAYAFSGITINDDVILPNSVYIIGISAFKNTTINGRFSFPNNAKYKKIFNSLFENATIKSDLIIPNTVDEIKHGAFRSTSLGDNYLYLPKDLKKINSYAFYSSRVKFKDDLILDNLEELGEEAFANFVFDNDIKFGPKLKVIKNQTFAGTHFSKNKKFILPDSIETIEKHAFDSSVFISGNIGLPNNRKFTVISEGLFNNCKSLEGDLSLPDTIVKIEKDAFKGAYNLNNIYLSNNIEIIGKEAFANLNNDDSKVSERIVKLPNNSKFISIEKGVFNNSRLNNTDIKIPDSVKFIKENAFNSNYLKGNLNLPSNIEHIGNSSFSNNKLESLEIPKNAVMMGSWFDNNPSLVLNNSADIDLNEYNFKDLGYIFSGIKTKIKNKITLPKKTSVVPNGFFMESEVETFVIPDHITTVEGNAFKNTIINKLTFPSKTLKLIDDEAFMNCKGNLTNKLSDSICDIGVGAFANSRLLKGNILLSNKLEYVAELAFNNALEDVAEITIPDSLKVVRNDAFGNNSKVKIKVDRKQNAPGYDWNSCWNGNSTNIEWKI